MNWFILKVNILFKNKLPEISLKGRQTFCPTHSSQSKKKIVLSESKFSHYVSINICPDEKTSVNLQQQLILKQTTDCLSWSRQPFSTDSLQNVHKRLFKCLIQHTCLIYNMWTQTVQYETGAWTEEIMWMESMQKSSDRCDAAVEQSKKMGDGWVYLITASQVPIVE